MERKGFYQRWDGMCVWRSASVRLDSGCAVTRGKTGSGEIAWNSEPKSNS